MWAHYGKGGSYAPRLGKARRPNREARSVTYLRDVLGALPDGIRAQIEVPPMTNEQFAERQRQFPGLVVSRMAMTIARGARGRCRSAAGRGAVVNRPPRGAPSAAQVWPNLARRDPLESGGKWRRDRRSPAGRPALGAGGRAGQGRAPLAHRAQPLHSDGGVEKNRVRTLLWGGARLAKASAQGRGSATVSREPFMKQRVQGLGFYRTAVVPAGWCVAMIVILGVGCGGSRLWRGAGAAGGRFLADASRVWDEALVEPPPLGSEIAVLVSVLGRSADVTGLRLLATLSGQPVPVEEEAWGPGEKLLVRLPRGSAGRLWVQVDGVQDTRCAVTRGAGEVDVGAGGKVEVRVPLLRVAGGVALCPFSVVKTQQAAGFVAAELRRGDGAGAGRGDGAGAVEMAAIGCGPTCAAEYPAGTVVTLSAAPSAGYMFGGWFGACQGEGCTLRLDRAAQVVADFRPRRGADDLGERPGS